LYRGFRNFFPSPLFLIRFLLLFFLSFLLKFPLMGVPPWILLGVLEVKK